MGPIYWATHWPWKLYCPYCPSGPHYKVWARIAHAVPCWVKHRGQEKG